MTREEAISLLYEICEEAYTEGFEVPNQGREVAGEILTALSAGETGLRVFKDESGLWVAHDVERDVVGQGKTRTAAIRGLAEAEESQDAADAHVATLATPAPQEERKLDTQAVYGPAAERRYLNPAPPAREEASGVRQWDNICKALSLCTICEHDSCDDDGPVILCGKCWAKYAPSPEPPCLYCHGVEDCPAHPMPATPASAPEGDKP